MNEIQFSLYIYFPKGKKGCILKRWGIIVDCKSLYSKQERKKELIVKPNHGIKAGVSTRNRL